MAAELDRLRAFEDVEQFNHDFTFGLARLYAIGKAVVMMRLVQDGTPEFNREKAFEAMRQRRPELPRDRLGSPPQDGRNECVHLGACAKRRRVPSRPDN